MKKQTKLGVPGLQGQWAELSQPTWALLRKGLRQEQCWRA